MRFNKLTKTLTSTMLAVVMGVGLAGFSGPADAAKTIKIAFLGSQADEDYDGSLVFKDYVESRTNGEVTVEIYFGGQFCGSFQECIDQIMSGVLEVTISTIGGFGNIFPPGQALDLPYMFRDDRVAECVFDGPFVGELRAAVLESVGPMRLMTVSNTGGWRNFATVNTQIRTPADVKGQKIRTIPADIQIEMVKMLGGAPTPVSWPEVYTSLATGVVEGTKNGITDITNMKFQEHLRYMTLDGHAYMAALWWMNDDFFNGLTPGPAQDRARRLPAPEDGDAGAAHAPRDRRLRGVQGGRRRDLRADAGGEDDVPGRHGGHEGLVRRQVRRRVADEAPGCGG